MSGLALVVGLLGGLVFGLFGAGGAILTVPALVYVLGLDVTTAVSTSLVVVGTNAVVGAVVHHQGGRVRWRTALPFGGGGLIGAIPGARVNAALPDDLVLLLFALVLLSVGLMMLRGGEWRPAADSERADRRLPETVVCGIGVGFLVGLFGVGGGFLNVPALAGLLGLRMAEAIGTSVAIIALNSASGLVGHAMFGRVELAAALPLIAGGLPGILLGGRLAGRLSPKALHRGFAVLLLALAALVAARNAPALIAVP